MAYDVLIRNGRIVDGSGMPSFNGDVAVKDGKIVELGKLSGAAGQTIDVEGRAISPGFIDNHCHYDAQVTWDPLCSFSCDHGATSVVIGNCSLSLAPVRKGKEKRMAEFLSYVEAIPMEVLNTVEVDWESFPQYMDRLDRNLGVNVGTLMGHTAIRYYVMDDECQSRAATDDELTKMQAVVRDELAARAALQGKSMQEFLRAELERLAARPSIDAWLQQVRKRKRATQTRISSKQILENRNADRR